VTEIDPVLAGVGDSRLEWTDLPADVRSSIEQRLGSKVRTAVSQPQGFSPAMASRLVLADGRRCFAKAIGPDDLSGAPGGQDIYRREAAIAARLPAAAPAPRLLESWETDRWLVLLFEDVDGRHPSLPWEHREFSNVLDAISTMSNALTPSPVSAPPAEIPGGVSYWALLAAHPEPLHRLSDLDLWATENVDKLATLELTSGPVYRGATLVHTDIRADNILLTDEAAIFVDWPHARIGPPWLDLLWFLPSVAMQGGPEPNAVFWNQPAAANADRDSVIGVLCGIAGFFLFGATQPAPPGLPHLRKMQYAQGAQALRWVKKLLA
jgi:hypothetical protein